MSLTYVFGIDPGLHGAVACYSVEDQRLTVHDMPTEEFGPAGMKTTVDGRQLTTLMLPLYREAEGSKAMAVLERVSARPGQGVTSMFNFGMGYGIVIGVLQALKIPIIYTPPSVWKSALGLDKEKTSSLHRARLVFPGYEHYFLRRKDDGRAEAALLAKFGADRVLSTIKF